MAIRSPFSGLSHHDTAGHANTPFIPPHLSISGKASDSGSMEGGRRSVVVMRSWCDSDGDAGLQLSNTLRYSSSTYKRVPRDDGDGRGLLLPSRFRPRRRFRLSPSLSRYAKSSSTFP